MKAIKVAVVMGSDSDFPVIAKCLGILKEFNVEYEVFVISAHRTPKRAAQFALNAEEEGFGVIIAAAGKAAHLAGVIASYTILPVIGLPIRSSTLDGLDSLLSTVQMPKGVPVATVAVDGAENAGLLAVEMLAISDRSLKTALFEYRNKISKEVEEKDRKIKDEANNL
ncbi:MAG: 5-(carboxyamino)imidazole ribonucleotide mutase [Clostridiaceae bacterium]|nr:5-(carboxyamino)imidazole ribonucleotide mutase [Clostridiaceae bacterium]